MPVGETYLIKILEEHLAKYKESGFIFLAPFFFKETESRKLILTISTSNLGRISLGSASIKNYEIEKITSPIFEKHNIPWNEWSTTFVSEIPKENRNRLIPVDNETEIKEALKEIDEYIENYCFTVWNSFSDIDRHISVINSKSEEELNKGSFQGVTGIMNRMTITCLLRDKYFDEKSTFYKTLLKEYREKTQEQYTNLYNGYIELIDTLKTSYNKG